MPLGGGGCLAEWKVSILIICGSETEILADRKPGILAFPRLNAAKSAILTSNFVSMLTIQMVVGTPPCPAGWPDRQPQCPSGFAPAARSPAPLDECRGSANSKARRDSNRAARSPAPLDGVQGGRRASCEQPTVVARSRCPTVSSEDSQPVRIPAQQVCKAPHASGSPSQSPVAERAGFEPSCTESSSAGRSAGR